MTTVLAKLSANGAHGRLAVVPAALLCAIMIAGCGSGGAAVTGTGPRDPGQSALAASPSPSACSPWTGLDDLFSITTWLRQMIGDEVIFGSGTQQARRDGLVIVVYAESLDGHWANLPPQYARALRDSVLPVAASPYRQTPEQLNTAANDAESLATRISQLCF